MVKNLQAFHLNSESKDEDVYMCFKWAKYNLSLGNPVTVIIRKDSCPHQSLLYNFFEYKKQEIQPSPKLTHIRHEKYLEGLKLMQNHRYYEATKLFQEAHEQLKKDGQKYPQPKIQQSQCYINLNLIDQALQSLSLIEGLVANRNSQIKYSVYSMMAFCFSAKKNILQAEKLWRRSLEVANKLQVNKIYSQSQCQFQLSKILLQKNKLEESLQRIELSLALLSKLLHLPDGERRTLLLKRLQKKGEIQMSQKNYQSAITTYDELIGICQQDQSFGNLVQYYYYKAMNLKLIQNGQLSFKAMEKAYQLISQQTRAQLVVNIKTAFGDELLKLARFQEAAQLLEGLYDNICLKTDLSKKELLIANLYGQSHLKLRNFQKAFQVFVTIKSKTATLASRRPLEVAKLLYNLGMCLSNLHRYDQALKEYKGALTHCQRSQKGEELKEKIIDTMAWQIFISKEESKQA